MLLHLWMSSFRPGQIPLAQRTFILTLVDGMPW